MALVEWRRSPSFVLAGLFATAGLLPAPPTRAQAQADAAFGWAELFRDVRFTLGPVLARGEVTTEYRSLNSAGQGAQRSFQESANLSLASYIYQPWLAQVSGNLGLVWSNDSGPTSPGGLGLTGGGFLAVFPASRFPLELSLTVSDSRTSQEVVGSDYRSVRAGLKQSYRTAKEDQLTLRLDHSLLSSKSRGRDTLNVLAATASGRRKAHTVNADVFVSSNEAGSGGRTRTARAGATHSYLPAENLSVETIASFDRFAIRQRIGPLSLDAGSHFAQVATYASWRPDEEQPLYDENHPLLVTGGLRFAATGARAGAGVGQLSADALSFSGTAGLNYDLAPWTRLVANGAFSQTSFVGRSSRLQSGLSANVAHDPPPLRWGGLDYTWRVGAGALGAGGGSNDRVDASVQASHSLGYAKPLFDRASLGFTFGQAVAAAADTRDRRIVGLTHNAQLTFTLPGESATHTYLSLSASDSRAYGTSPFEFQLVNLQFTRQAPIDRLSSWSANLTVQASRQAGDPGSGNAPPTLAGGFSTTVLGSLTYSHRRVFGVPQLTLLATYTASQAQLQSRAQGDLNAPLDEIGDSFDARLEHRIGKLSTQLVARSAEVNGRRNNGIYLRATRNF